MSHEYITVLASAARTTTTSSSVYDNHTYRSFLGIRIVIDITSVPGVATITPKIEGYDTLSGKYFDILVGAARSTTGTICMCVYPSKIEVANFAASDVLSASWRVTITHSAASSFTYSISATLID